jgi:hypothetical protein
MTRRPRRFPYARDREWYLTHEQFRLRLVDLVDRVLERLEADAAFTFHLDGQTVVLEDYLDVRPEQEERLRAHVASGRLLVGPWYVMPDQFLVSGEALVRNLARGHRIARRFGGGMRADDIPDPPGHVAQMPQIRAASPTRSQAASAKALSTGGITGRIAQARTCRRTATATLAPPAGRADGRARRRCWRRAGARRRARCGGRRDYVESQPACATC